MYEHDPLPQFEWLGNADETDDRQDEDQQNQHHGRIVTPRGSGKV